MKAQITTNDSWRTRSALIVRASDIEDGCMFRALWALSLVAIMGSLQSVAQPAAKVTTIRKVNTVTARLLEIAEKRVAHSGDPARATLENEIDRVLQGLSNPDVLARVALVSNIYLRPGNAGDEAFDDVFDIAWATCIRRIEQIGGKSAIDALESIQAGMHLDGSYSLQWEESIERLKAKQDGRK